MARIVGESLLVIWQTGGTAVRLDGDQTAFDLTWSSQSADLTAATDAGVEEKPTIEEISYSLSSFFDSSQGTAWLNVVPGQEGTLVFGPQGSDGNDPKGGSRAFVASKSPSIPFNDGVIQTIEFRGLGTTIFDIDQHFFIDYLFRDDASNAVVGTPDTIGRHTVVTIDGTYTKTDGRLVFTAQSTPVWGDQGIIMLPAVDANFVRANGMALFATLNLSTWEESGFGWHTAAAVVDPDSMEAAIQANTTDGRLDNENGEPIFTGLSTSTDYKIAIVLRATGAYIFLHDGTEWLLIFISDVGATSALFAVLANFDGAGDYDLRRITQLPAGRIPTPVVSDSFSLIPTIADAGVNGLDGTPVRVGLNGSDGSFDGANSFVQLPAVAMDAAGFDGGLGGLIAQAQVPSDVVWPDGAFRRLLRLWGHNDDRLYIRKNANSNIDFVYIAGGAGATVSAASGSPAGTFTAGMSWSDFSNDDRMIAYLDGAQTGATQTGFGTWTNDLAAANTVLGALDNTPSSEQWIGKIPNAIIWLGYEPSAADMAEVDTKLAAGTLTVADLNTITDTGGWMWYQFGELYRSDGLGHLEADGNGSGVIQQGGTWSNAGNKAFNAPLGGDEVIVNGGFDADTDWTKGTGWTIADGVATSAPGSGTLLTADVNPLTIGQWYTLTFTVLNFIAGTFRNRIGTTNLVPRTANGTFTETTIAGGAIYAMAVNGTADGDVDNITAQQLALADLLRPISISSTDVILRDDLTITDDFQAGIAARWDSQSSPDNGIIVWFDRGFTEQIVVGKYVAGTYTEVSATATTYSAGAKLEVRCIDTEVRVFYNNVHVVTGTVSNAGIINNTLHGTFGTDNVTTHENFETWPVDAINYDAYFAGV